MSLPTLGACTPSRPILSFSFPFVLALGRGLESHSDPSGPNKACKSTAVTKRRRPRDRRQKTQKKNQEGRQPEEEEEEAEGSHRGKVDTQKNLEHERERVEKYS